MFRKCEKRTSDKCKVIVHTKTGDATVIKKINEHNHSGNGATPEQMLRLLKAFTFYALTFLENFLNVNQIILRTIRARK